MKRAALLLVALALGAIGASTAAAQDSLPPGHPHVEGGEPALPPGHPHVDGNEQAGHVAGMFEATPDSVIRDPLLPPGTIAVELRGPEGQPMPHQSFTLGILEQSVAKGDNRTHLAGETNESGDALMKGLAIGAGIAYRVSVVSDGATFAAMPFQLEPSEGVRAVVHVYPVTRKLDEALIAMQLIAYGEVRDDRIQMNEGLSVFNFGRVAWVPNDVILPLPEGFSAVVAQTQMSDVSVDEVAGKGVRLRGTFGPGQTNVEFKWQLPYSGSADVDFEIGTLPRVAISKVLFTASRGMRLEVGGFPPAQMATDPQGDRVLITEKQFVRGDPLPTTLRIALHNLPSAGPGRFVAAILTGLLVVFGIALVFRRANRPESAGEHGEAHRAELLRDIVDLEAAHVAGEIGPRTFERARRELIDAISRSLAEKKSKNRM